MSANLLVGVKPKLASGATESDGIISIAANTGSERNVVEYAIPGQSALSANKTCHIGVSLRTASGGNEWTSAVVEYADSAGNANGVSNVTSATGDGAWHRHELSVVVPSGMHVVGIHFNQDTSGTAIDFANPTLSYGSAVCLASSAHTPYATQDHVSVTYATKASLKVTDDSVKSEVRARAQTDGTVSELSTRLTQTADAFHLSINRLSETDKKVNSWFDFDSDSSGNPQLKMGSSTSPVVGIYSNTGLAYKARSGATLMELDASRSATVADHMETQDAKIGKWKWIQTQGGAHLTLVWAG